MTIHERLKAARRKAGYASAAAAAKAFGWPVGTYSCHENGSRGIKLDVVERYARAFEVDPVWLLHGGETPTFGARLVRNLREAMRAKLDPDEPHTLLVALDEARRQIETRPDTDYNLVAELTEGVAWRQFKFHVDEIALTPGEAELLTDALRAKVVALAAVAGGGGDAASEAVVGHVWFRRERLQSKSIDPTNCALMGVRGPSMHPTLPDGYSILVDLSRTEKVREGKFVFRTQVGLAVKHMIEPHDGEWWLLTETFDSELEPIPDDADIFGQIVWAGRVILDANKD